MFHLCKGAVAVSAETFGEGSASRLLSRADCVGNESSLLQCPTTQYSGGGCVTSGVACQGEHCLLSLSFALSMVWHPYMKIATSKFTKQVRKHIPWQALFLDLQLPSYILYSKACQFSTNCFIGTRIKSMVLEVVLHNTVITIRLAMWDWRYTKICTVFLPSLLPYSSL